MKSEQVISRRQVIRDLSALYAVHATSDAPLYKDLRMCRHAMEACKYVGQSNGTARARVWHWMGS